MTGVLLTGGFGYLGSWIRASLGTAVPVLVTSRSPQLSASANPYPIVAIGSATDSDFCEKTVQEVSSVVHLASPPDNEKQLSDDQIISTHEMMARNIALAAVRRNINTLIYLSTVHVYGTSLDGRVTRDTPCRATTAYGLGHLVAEEIIREITSNSSVRTIIFRLANGYGSPTNHHSQAWRFFINDVCKQIISSGAVQLRSHGLHCLDFVPMKYVAETVKHALQNQDFNSGTYLLGSGVSETLKTVAQSISEHAEPIVGHRISVSVNADDNTKAVEYNLDTQPLGEYQYLQSGIDIATINDLLRAARSS